MKSLVKFYIKIYDNYRYDDTGSGGEVVTCITN